jgi:hypothetical protein
MAAKNPELRSLLARKAIRARYSRMSPAERVASTNAARAAYIERLRDEVDPDRLLDPADLDERVRHLRQLKMTELAIARVKAKKAAEEAAELDELIDGGAA